MYLGESGYSPYMTTPSISQLIREAKATIEQRTKDSQFFIGRDRILEGCVHNLVQAVEKLSELNTTLATATLEKLELKPGDVVVLKLGDSALGWIPGPESEARILELFSEAFKIAGIDDKVSAVIWNYALQTEVLRVDMAKAV